MRLAKYLAHAGVASRRASEEIVAAGRVTVEGVKVTDPAFDVSDADLVCVDGSPLSGAEERVAYMLNKPVGVLSTASDTHGRTTVVGLIGVHRARMYPVGRLDAQTTGLILLTNDGELANRLTHPRFEVPKTYRARLGGGPVREPALQALQQGVELEDGPTAPALVRRVGPQELEITIREGRNRQVRRMCEHVGHPVLELQRTRFGPLRLGELAPGEHRPLTAAELGRLRAL